MASLAEIVGQPRAILQLAAGYRSNRLHHAFLFEGPQSVGKASTARALASAINCQAPVARILEGLPFDDACGHCSACRRIAQGVHPDVISFDVSPKGLTERVRELLAPLAYAPHEAKERFVLIDPADDLAGAQGRAEAANALLKTLEEPPSRTRFVLITSQSRRLPVTLRSRCQTVRFAPLGRSEIVQLLVAQHGAEPDAANLAAQSAEGSLSAAIARLEVNETERGLEAAVTEYLSAIEDGDRLGILASAQRLGGDRQDALAAMHDAKRRVRDRIVLPKDQPQTFDLALWRALEQATQCLQGNVSPVLALEHAGLSISNLGAEHFAAVGANR